jgi:hypothetical protein
MTSTGISRAETHTFRRMKDISEVLIHDDSVSRLWLTIEVQEWFDHGPLQCVNEAQAFTTTGGHRCTAALLVTTCI